MKSRNKCGDKIEGRPVRIGDERRKGNEGRAGKTAQRPSRGKQSGGRQSKPRVGGRIWDQWMPFLSTWE